MSVMAAVMVKESALWLPRFINQVEHLDGDIRRVVCMYGSSMDNTYALLKHWQKTSKRKIEVYQEPYLPEEERHSFTLARVKRDIQELLRQGDEEYYLKLDADLVELPKTLILDLMRRDKDLVAPMIWIEGLEPKVFFDTFMFRLNGCMFHPLDPPGKGKTEPFQVDSVSCCTLATREVALAGVYQNPYSCIPFCHSLRKKGYKVWVDPDEDVYHVNLEALGILHLPIACALANVPYITSGGLKLTVEQTVAQKLYWKELEYERWMRENKPDEAKTVQQWMNSRPLITASYKVFNEANFLPYSIRSIYPYVDSIDIAEGATRFSTQFADENGASIDGTVELLKKFPDPEHKIRVIQGKWNDREQAQAKLLEMCAGRWMLYIDGDEIIDAQSMRRLRGWCLKHQDGKIVYARPERFYNFWHDFSHIAYSTNPLSPWAQFGLPHAFLVWRDIPGLNFQHYHTEPADGFGIIVNVDHPFYRKCQAVLDGVFVYHFGNAKGSEALMYKLSQPDGRQLGTEDEDPWFSGVMPKDMVIERFASKIPRILHSHPEYGKRRIKVTQTNPYRFELVQ